MLMSDIAAILDRDLRALAREVEAYADEADLWRLPEGVPNSAGTLALHLAGNIQYYIGACLGQTGYVRDRAAEFGSRNVPRAVILREIEAARSAVRVAATRAGSRPVQGDFPEPIATMTMAAGEYLVHLVAHFAYHLGQLDYHRRLVTRDGASVGALNPRELGSARPAG